MSLKYGILQFINGFKDSYNGCFKFYKKQKLIREKNQQECNNKNGTQQILFQNQKKLEKRILESCLLNGLFLFFCIVLFNYVLMPFLNWFIFGFLFTIDKNQESSSKISINSYYIMIHDYLNKFIYLLFSIIWIIPVFLLSKIFNFICFQDIADISYMNQYGKPKITSAISYLIAESIFSCLLQVVFLVQSSLIVYIPIYTLNQILFHLHISVLYSLYAFEYKWFNMDWNIKKRLKYIESKWPYFFGFGLSLSILTSLSSSYIISATLFAFLFPALLICAIEADCNELDPKNANKLQRHSSLLTTKTNQNGTRESLLVNFTPLHLFDLSIIVTDHIFRFIKYLSDKRRASNKVNVNGKSQVKQ